MWKQAFCRACSLTCRPPLPRCPAAFPATCFTQDSTPPHRSQPPAAAAAGLLRACAAALTANPCRPAGEGGRPRCAIAPCVKSQVNKRRAGYQSDGGAGRPRKLERARCKSCPTPMCVDGLLTMAALSRYANRSRYSDVGHHSL
jgi:hypothetical protein